MTDKLKCPFCGTELNDYPDKTTGARMAVCRNPKCKYDGWHFPVEIIQRMIDGKKAQRQLRAVKDRCVKKVKAKELEIHNCLYGIHVRDCEIETLQEKLSQAQDALNVATDFIGFVNTSRHADGALAAMAICKLNEITSITKQEFNNEK